MKTLHTSKTDCVILVCTECEKRSNGPRDLNSKVVANELRHLATAGTTRAHVRRARCLDLCPNKALAAKALGEALPAVDAFMKDHADVRKLARYAFRK